MKKSQFIHILKIVIDNFEGGYYHPQMLTDGRLKISDPEILKLYQRSGETMLGLDRKNGGNLNTSAEGKAFWKVVDANSKNWGFNYLGGKLNSVLKELLAQIMYRQFMYLWNKYLSTKLQKIISKDARLVLHFAYATWNGEGFFKFYTQSFENAVNKGVRDSNKLAIIAIQDRINSKSKTIRISGKKMQKLFDKMGSNHRKAKILFLISGTGIALFTGIKIYKARQK